MLSRTIFAKQIYENILSVPEAVDKGLSVVFSKEGVQFYQASDIYIKADPVLRGHRDSRTRLFYFDMDPRLSVPSKLSPFQFIPVAGSRNSIVGDRWYDLARAARTQVVTDLKEWMPPGMPNSTNQSRSHVP